MILSLHIKNIGIIEDLSVDLNNGLNVLTGETGAGKTLIIDSLQIISGGRFSKEMIRKGETNSFVELCMYNPESEYAVDGNIIVSREININGKNMCKINGRMVTVNELKEFMMNFIEIHGQNDNQTILDTKSHIKYLDGFIFNELREKKEEYVKLYDRYIEIKNELKMNYGDDKERQRKLDLLKYQMDEIEEANLKIHEEEELEEKRKIFLNSEKISENLIEADTLLSENTIDSLSMVIRALEKIENNELNIVKEKLNQLGRKISNIRKKGADKLSANINNELEDLEMKNAKINVKVQYMEEEFYKNGKDIVKFYITTNLGEDEKELSKIASGGEMSRTMLAIKKVLADTDNMPILIFDEIDTGISGKAANSVANKLKAISKKHQVICISHLPNIAANADYNYFISKDVNGERTKTKIKQLEEEEIIKEIARISSGEINEITLKYAYELRNKKNNEAA